MIRYYYYKNMIGYYYFINDKYKDALNSIEINKKSKLTQISEESEEKELLLKKNKKNELYPIQNKILKLLF